MTTYLVPLVLIGALTSAGVYLLLDRHLTRMLLGLLLIGNAINLLILTVGGPATRPCGAASATVRPPLPIHWPRG
jgi:multicomponent Na+:H+ antiporter subunit C